MSRIPIFVVDAFASAPFTGNPAAVCLLDCEPDSAWMQAVANEMNLSETAFVWPTDGDAGNDFHIRWCTPTVEVALCGHATLAAAHILWETGAVPAVDHPLHFHSRSVELVCRRFTDRIEMDFPATALTYAAPLPGLADALGVDPVALSIAGPDLLVEAADEAAVHAARPHFSLLRVLQHRGVIVTARSDDERYDFVSRFFAPSVGLAEDPVTGSAHCALAPYWSARLGKTSMSGYQASARGGEVGVRLVGDRVILTGQAITVLTGKLQA